MLGTISNQHLSSYTSLYITYNTNMANLSPLNSKEKLEEKHPSGPQHPRRLSRLVTNGLSAISVALSLILVLFIFYPSQFNHLCGFQRPTTHLSIEQRVDKILTENPLIGV